MKDADQFEHAEITETIIGSAFEVIEALGCGFLESVYEKAMLISLRKKSLNVLAQHPVDVFFKGEPVGHFFADLFVEEKVIVEFKATKALLPEHHAQIINYLNAARIDVGLLINFGKPRLEYKRFMRKELMTRNGKTTD